MGHFNKNKKAALHSILSGKSKENVIPGTVRAKELALQAKAGKSHPHHPGLKMSDYKKQMKTKGYASHKGFAVKNPKTGKYPSPNV